MTNLLDPQRAFALLLGVRDYKSPAEYHPLPSCRASVERLYALLTDTGPDARMWKLPPERVCMPAEPVTTDDARVALADAVDRDLDALLVCISCHGARFADTHTDASELHLALSSSLAEHPGSHWRFGEIESKLGEAAQRIKHIVLIIDACYADGLEVRDRERGMSA